MSHKVYVINRIWKYRGSLTLFLLIRSALFEHKH